MPWKQELLLIPDKPDVERDALAKAWEERGGQVQRIGKFWQQPSVEGWQVSLYGFDSFCQVLAQLLNLTLLCPRDELVVDLEAEYIKRQMELRPLGSIGELSFPLFVKSVVPKLFPAAVYGSAEELRQNTQGLEAQELLICSSVVPIEKELRCFIFQQQILDLAFYEGRGDLEEARQFVLSFLHNTTPDLPETYVLDLAYNSELGWFILEFNSTWGAGLNYCQPTLVVEGIRAATQSAK